METIASISMKKPFKVLFVQFEKIPLNGLKNLCSKERTTFKSLCNNQVLRFFQSLNDRSCDCLKGAQNLKFITMKTQPQMIPILIKVMIVAIFSVFVVENAWAQNKTSDLKNNLQTQHKAQDTYLKGTINDASGPLAGANILLKDSEIGVTADFDGKFTFPKILKEGDVLLVSYIGYKTKKITIAKHQEFLNVTLTPEDIDLLGAVPVKKVYSSKKK